MNDRTMTAMYDSRGAAETARDELVALGIPAGAILVRGTDTGETATTEDKGFWASLGDMFFPDDDRTVYEEGVRRGGYLLTARVPAGLEDQASDILERSDPVDLDARAETWRQSGWTGIQATTVPTEVVDASLTATDRETRLTDSTYGSAAPAGTGYAARAGEEDVVQAAEEQLRVGKREVGHGSVRVRSYVTERPVEEQVALREETVQVERRQVDRPITAGDAAFQEKEIEASERGEEAVISKEARVTEEIALRKDVDTRTETIRDTVRKQEIEVEDERTDVDVNRSGTLDPGYRTDR
jgi:uncharacterized protein (TIGR02271 family)